ncbi:MAG: zinc dependent phospholipase C family protein [Methanomassiliicoccus sp.]|nr:zinc dependent phospholipase C family protein [Methanomassiliicoccus sp.]
MKWKSHTAIARAIAAEMNLPEDLERAFCAGSIEPDKRPDLAYRVSKGGRTYIGRAPHHMPPTGTIMAYAWRARKAYLAGNDYWAVKSLGRGLHYVQDKCVHTGFKDWRHDARESDIAALTPPRKAVREGIEMAKCSPRFVHDCIVSVKPRRDPRRALYDATMFSSAIFASVIGPIGNRTRFASEYDKAVRGHRHRYVVATVVLAATAATAYLLEEPLFLIPGSVAALAAIKLDLDFYRVKDEAEWFGIEPRHR